jgi:hypothetical protein
MKRIILYDIPSKLPKKRWAPNPTKTRYVVLGVHVALPNARLMFTPDSVWAIKAFHMKSPGWSFLISLQQ